MADQVYEQRVAAFDVWWRENQAARWPLETRSLALAAWRAAWDAGREHENLEPGSDEPEKRNWDKIRAETRAAANLAARNGLVITSVPGTNDKRVKAVRGGSKPVYVQVAGWAEMIHVLKDMEKRGAL